MIFYPSLLTKQFGNAESQQTLLFKVPKMDHHPEHKDAPEQALADILAAKDLIELFLKMGKAQELNLASLRDRPNTLFEINGISLEGKLIAHLVDEARRGQGYAYAPYSHFNVGAAILAANRAGEQKVFSGCNVENAAYGSTICAERTATFKAVSEGFRKFHAYAVVGGFDQHVSKALRTNTQKSYITPCGSCRQVMNEFEASPCAVIMAKGTGEIYMTTLNYLLPSGFGPRALGVDAADYDGGYANQLAQKK